MTDKLWVSSKHSLSGRSAIVADEGESVWLYLTAATSSDVPPTPVADRWLFNQVDAPTTAEVQARRGGYRAGTPARAGYSAHLVTVCPWGQPLDMDHYKRFFQSPSSSNG